MNNLKTMRVRSGLLAITAAATAWAPGAQAQDATEENAAPAESAGVGSALHVGLGVDWTNQYYFRGIIQETEGLILQPWGELGVDLVEFSHDTSLGLTLGIWNSVHGDNDSAGTSDDFTENWYEADLYAGLSLTAGDLTFSATYTAYTSPSDAFNTVDEIAVGIALDDSEDPIFGFALQPYATIAFEVGDDFADGVDRGTYLELGIEPGTSFELNSTTDVDISFPVTLGLSLDDYYQDSTGDDETFGFFDIGVAMSMPLGIPDEYGVWSFGASIHLLVLGDSMKELNDNSDTEIVGFIGVGVEF